LLSFALAPQMEESPLFSEMLHKLQLMVAFSFMVKVIRWLEEVSMAGFATIWAVWRAP